MTESRVSSWALRLREAATANLGYKLVSAVLTLAMFSVVRGAGVVQRSVDVPLTVMLPNGAAGQPVLLTQLPDSVQVTVRGSPSVLNAMRGEELGPIQIDLRDGHRLMQRFDSGMVSVPAGVTVVSYHPDALRFQWDVLVSRVLPIRGTVVGSPAARTRIGVIEVEPEQIRVRGPSVQMEPLSVVHTAPIDATGLAPGRYERRTALEPPPIGLDYGFASVVRVIFTVEPLMAERRFEHLSVVPVGPVGVTLRPPMVDVVVRGDPTVVEGLHPSAVVPFVAWTEQGPLHGISPRQVQVRPLPDGVTGTTVTPGEVLVVPR